MTVRVLFAAAALLLMSGCCREQTPVQAPVAEECDDLTAERDQLAREAAELRRIAERRQAIYDELRRELADLISAGRVNIVFRRGMIVLQMPNQILFQSGRADLRDEGRETITAVGEAIADISDRRFLVAGHTDDRPIQASSWPSNWHLSSARAQAVLQVLLDAGVAPTSLAAAGFGEFDPVGGNDTPEGQAGNRRTEIMVVPNLEQIFRAAAGEDAS